MSTFIGMRQLPAKHLFRGGLLAALILLPSASFAQTASQITPPSFRPALERPGGFALPGTPGLATPAGAEKLFAKLAGVRINGGLPQLAAATAELEARLSGSKVSGADVFAAARDLEAAYARAGYVLVRVILPPQQLVNGGRLQLVVVDGFIERIETKDVPQPVRDRITQLVGPLAGRHGITLAEIERRVLLAGDTPGVLLRSTLAPGKAVGATVLVVEAKYQAVSKSLSFDNTLPASLGGVALGVGLDFNSIAGRGEQVYLGASGQPDIGDTGYIAANPRNRTLAGGVTLPLGIVGLTFNAEYIDARTSPVPVAGVQTTDSFDRLSLRLRYAWLRGRMANFNSELAFEPRTRRRTCSSPGCRCRCRRIDYASCALPMTAMSSRHGARPSPAGPPPRSALTGSGRAAPPMRRRACRCRARAPMRPSRSWTSISATASPC